MMETKLLPCPFCGGEAIAEDLLGDYWHVYCQQCKAGTSIFNESDLGNTKEQAIEAWNTRHEKTCDGCKHFGKIVDYHIDPCCECVRNAPDLYEPKEDTDVD